MTAQWISLVNLSMDAAALMLMLVVLLTSLVLRNLETWTKRFFVLTFSVLSLYIFCNLVSEISENYGGSAALTKLAIFYESLFSSSVLPLLTLYLVLICAEDYRKSRVFGIVNVLWLVYIVLLIVTQFTTAIYYISPDNVYHRGPWYPMLLAPPFAIMVAILIGLVHRREKLSRRQFSAFLVYILVPMLATLLQMLVYGVYFIVIGTAIAAVVMFVVILTDQVQQYVRQREENARQRASIMVLQMRPHFIYNTMMSIYYLCQQDALKAQQVILDFTSYLRKNFTAIAKEDTISFTEELEHTRAYLAVEQIRFEGELFVEFDTPHTQFRLPPLTLQPIVENAVKYGVDPELEPLYISVRTRDTGDGSEVVVEDTGPGFGASSSSDGAHIALSNIRERLDLMCGGTLTVAPREGGGTVVTILVPKSTQD